MKKFEFSIFTKIGFFWIGSTKRAINDPNGPWNLQKPNWYVKNISNYWFQAKLGKKNFPIPKMYNSPLSVVLKLHSWPILQPLIYDFMKDIFLTPDLRRSCWSFFSISLKILSTYILCIICHDRKSILLKNADRIESLYSLY